MNRKYYKRINNLDIALEKTNHKYIMINQWAIDNSHKWRKSDNYDEDYCSDDVTLAGIGYIFSICIIALGIGLIIGNIFGIVKNICMPEMVVYEYITNIQ